MLSYALRRVLSAIPVALIAVTACFFILRLAPGGPFDQERALPETILRNLRAAYDLDQPLITQYLLYIGRLLRGDLGPSMVVQDFTVSQLLALGLPFSVMLGLVAFVIATIIGLIAGVIAAVTQNKWPDYVLVLVVMIGVVVPNFLMGSLLQLLFGVYLRWLPAGGWRDGPLGNLAPTSRGNGSPTQTLRTTTATDAHITRATAGQWFRATAATMQRWSERRVGRPRPTCARR